MKYFYLLLIGTLVTTGCNATTCMQDEHQSAKLNEFLKEHSEVAILNSTASETERLVNIKIPYEFIDLSFSSISLRKDKRNSGDEVEYWIPLSERVEGKFAFTNFNMSEELLRGAKLEITFKKHRACGVSTELNLIDDR